MKDHIKTIETENKLFLKEKLYVIKNQSVILNKRNGKWKRWTVQVSTESKSKVGTRKWF